MGMSGAMHIIIFSIGIIMGILLNACINKISSTLSTGETIKINLYVHLITGVVFLVAFLKLQLSILFLKAIVLSTILIVVSFIDLKHRIIPNSIVIVTLLLGIIFLFIGDISLMNSILGMIFGGGLLLLFALIPGAMGGGDIKIMFALGAFLGYRKTLWALILAFVLASIISVMLILFKIKGRRDHIPFGPFLALGTFISFLFL